MNFDSDLVIDRHLTLPSRAVLSPMQGVMKEPFIYAANEMALIRSWITPFISVSPGGVPSVRVLRKMIAPYVIPGAPLIVQLAGHDPESLAATAEGLAETECVAGVNLNFACPSPTVLAGGNGGACLDDLKLLRKIASMCVEKASAEVNISVKIRTGFNDSSESSEIIKTVIDSGVNFIICHFRTVREMYDEIPFSEGCSRLEKVVDTAGKDVTVIGNGDIRSSCDAQKMVSSSGCHGIGVGRAILSDPFILSKICKNDEREAAYEEKMRFLALIFKYGADIRRGRSGRTNPFGGFLECVRMCFGVSSVEFDRIKRMKSDDIGEFLESFL